MSRLAKLRVGKGKTQEDMAKLLGIGVSTYNQYEKSHRTIPDETKQKIVEILEISRENEIFLPVRFTVSKIKEDSSKAAATGTNG
jgi:transcriptional regulator with XRE-family HTH domain